MKNFTAVRMWMVAALVVVAPVANAQVCGVARVEGQGCPDLKVTIDLSQCGANAKEVPARVVCDGTKATASAVTPEGTYTIPFTQREGWGQAEWVAGEIQFAARAKKAEATALLVPRKKIKLQSMIEEKAAPVAPAVAVAEPAVVAAPVAEEKTPAPAELPAAPAPAPAAAPSDPWSEAGIQFSATFDAYYSINFNNPTAPTLPVVTGSSGNFAPVNTVPAPSTQIRYYDAYANQFSLNLAEFSVRKKKGEVGFTLDLDFGLMADLNSTDEVGKHIGQAYVTYMPEWAPGLVIEVGKMPTHLGYELIKSKDNWQYSRSTTFGFGGPFWNNGLHIGYEVTPGLTISGYLNNTSVNNGFYTLSPKKSLGLQVKWVPSDKAAIVYNLVAGGRDSLVSDNDITIHEANVTYTANDRLAFALEMLAGRDTAAPTYGNSAWYGVTAHAKYGFNERFWVSPRLEWFEDTTGYRTAATSGHTLIGATLTNTLVLAKDFELRFELRIDKSTKNVFTKGDGSPTQTQATATWGVLYTFGN